MNDSCTCRKKLFTVVTFDELFPHSGESGDSYGYAYFPLKIVVLLMDIENCTVHNVKKISCRICDKICWRTTFKFAVNYARDHLEDHNEILAGYCTINEYRYIPPISGNGAKFNIMTFNDHQLGSYNDHFINIKISNIDVNRF